MMNIGTTVALRVWTAAGIVLVAGVGPERLRAEQGPAPPPPVAVSTFVGEREQELRLAVAVERLEAAPSDGRLMVEAARRAAEFALTNTADEARRVLAHRAFAWAEQAAVLDPNDVDARYWMAASAGLLADLEGGRTKIRWAERAWQESGAVLALDSLHAGAHHIQGRLHAAVMRLNRVLRFLARSLLGGDALSGASWEAAERHLALAASLDPAEPAHHLELAVLHLDRERPEMAQQALRAAADVELRTEPDRRVRLRARALLADVERAAEERGPIMRPFRRSPRSSRYFRGTSGAGVSRSTPTSYLCVERKATRRSSTPAL